jgi:hypothetical protein
MAKMSDRGKSILDKMKAMGMTPGPYGTAPAAGVRRAAAKMTANQKKKY